MCDKRSCSSRYMASSLPWGYVDQGAVKLRTMRLLTSYPKSWCCILRRLRVSNPAPASRTTDKVACTTTRAFWENEERSRVLRFTPRNASAGSACEVSHAGATPKSAPVRSDTADAKARTGIDGV